MNLYLLQYVFYSNALHLQPHQQSEEKNQRENRAEGELK